MVYIECLIMEVNVNKDFNIGTEWMAMGEASYEGREGGVGGGFSGGGDQPWTNTLGLINPSISEATGAAVGTLPAGFSLGVFSEAVKIGNVVFPNLAAVVAAFRQDKKVHILSTPQILTTDNEEATIMVGKNIPYQTRAGTGTTTVSEVYYNYEYKDVGITLKITPQISKDRLIRLKIFQEVQKLDQVQTTSDFRPTTLKRTVETTAIVKDKNTIVLGGLIEDSLSQTDYKVPCLGDIPWLGWAFKSFSSGREKTNLFIFLTPHVINTPEEANKIYDEKMDKAQSVEEGNIKLYEQRKDILDIEEDIKHYKPEKEIETNR
jgi:general secretion pathway protein D